MHIDTETEEWAKRYKFLEQTDWSRMLRGSVGILYYTI